MQWQVLRKQCHSYCRAQIGGYNSLQPLDWYIVWCHIRSLKKLIMCGFGSSPARLGPFLLDYILLPDCPLKQYATIYQEDRSAGSRTFQGCTRVAICFGIRPRHISVSSSPGHLWSHRRVSQSRGPEDLGMGWTDECIAAFVCHFLCLHAQSASRVIARLLQQQKDEQHKR